MHRSSARRSRVATSFSKGCSQRVKCGQSSRPTIFNPLFVRVSSVNDLSRLDRVFLVNFLARELACQKLN